MTDQQFADISSNNGHVDLAAYARAGFGQVAIKATQGTSYVNPLFAGQWAQAHALGLRRVAYHYATNADPEAQAQHFLAAVGPTGPGDLLCLDLEDPAQWASPAQPHSLALAWGRLMSGVLYTGRSFLTWANLNQALLPGWQLWLAYYSATPPDHPGWDSLWAWQYTQTGRAPGVTGDVDLSHLLAPYLPGGFLMALSDQQQEQLFAAIGRLEASGLESLPAAVGQLGALINTQSQAIVTAVKAALAQTPVGGGGLSEEQITAAVAAGVVNALSAHPLRPA